MRTIDITQILSTDLKSRDRASDLKLFINNCDDESIQIDFKNVQFATRSFIDEFYNIFIKNQSEQTHTIKLINVPRDIEIMIDSVSKTQNKPSIISTIKETADVESFNTVEDFITYINSVNF
ncbi:MAG TPA: hypothetical protein DDY68_06545 [Porphyromonadaceae bacterium]|nr:hypothetical protein [Porphyromonadaceae bacterium]